MFEKISEPMKVRMHELEEIDRRDRTDGTERFNRLRQIPPETGKFLALLASNCPEGDFVEIGTSAGYSALWIQLGLNSGNLKLKTFEISPAKAALARETFRQAGVEGRIELIEGDFFSSHDRIGPISFCFIDCEKDLYERFFDFVSAKMVRGGFIVADNAIDHYDAIKPMMDKASQDDRFDCVMVPIGKGEFVCRRK